MNVGKNKLPHTTDDILELAGQIEAVAEKLRSFAAEMERIGLPEFSFSKGQAVNTHLHGLNLWLAALQGDWERQRTIFEKSQRDAQRLAAGQKKLGRPRKARSR